MKRLCLLFVVLLGACGRTAPPSPPPATSSSAYLDYSGRDDALSGGVKMIPITTPKGTFHVWTKRVGNNPAVMVLLLHGGPAAGHEYMEAFDSYFPKAGIEYYYYDQLGSFFSDQPNEPSLWEIYVPMQGPSELGASGKLEHWDRSKDLSAIAMPTLVIGARYDTMDPAHMEMMSKQVQHGRYLFCPNGSHLAMYDDQKAYFDGVVKFIEDVDAGRFP